MRKVLSLVVSQLQFGVLLRERVVFLCLLLLLDVESPQLIVPLLELIVLLLDEFEQLFTGKLGGIDHSLTINDRGPKR